MIFYVWLYLYFEEVQTLSMRSALSFSASTPRSLSSRPMIFRRSAPWISFLHSCQNIINFITAVKEIEIWLWILIKDIGFVVQISPDWPDSVSDLIDWSFAVKSGSSCPSSSFSSSSLWAISQASRISLEVQGILHWELCRYLRSFCFSPPSPTIDFPRAPLKDCIFFSLSFIHSFKKILWYSLASALKLLDLKISLT